MNRLKRGSERGYCRSSHPDGQAFDRHLPELVKFVIAYIGNAGYSFLYIHEVAWRPFASVMYHFENDFLPACSVRQRPKINVIVESELLTR